MSCSLLSKLLSDNDARDTPGVLDDAVDTDGVDSLGVQKSSLAAARSRSRAGVARLESRGRREGHDAARVQDPLVMVTRAGVEGDADCGWPPPCRGGSGWCRTAPARSPSPGDCG